MKRINLEPETEFRRRKRERTEHYLNNIHGWILVTCGACSGYCSYKNGKCGWCEGTGKEREPGPKAIGTEYDYGLQFKTLLGR